MYFLFVHSLFNFAYVRDNILNIHNIYNMDNMDNMFGEISSDDEDQLLPSELVDSDQSIEIESQSEDEDIQLFERVSHKRLQNNRYAKDTNIIPELVVESDYIVKFDDNFLYGANHYEWSTKPIHTQQSRRPQHNIIKVKAGPTSKVNRIVEPVEIFKKFYD